MAQITDLPEEILLVIVRRLDFWSLNSMYNTCKSFRNVLCLPGIVVKCNMSLNVMATVNTLRQDFFKAISNHLVELNMCGVPDLTKTKVLPAFKKLKSLKVLDISYTNLNISDLMAIQGLCPSLKDITVNFVFGQAGMVQLPEATLIKYQTLFENFENVHFVGSINNLLFSKLALYILKKSKLETLKFSAVEVDNVNTTIIKHNAHCQIPHFNHFAVYLIDWGSTKTYDNLSKFPVLSMLELKNYEFFIVYTLNKHVVSVYATEIFKTFFSENFNVDVECVTDFTTNPIGNVALMIWNKEITKFDDIFFKKLYRRIKPYFPFHYEAHSEVVCPDNYDWIYTEPKAPGEVIPIDDDDHDSVDDNHDGEEHYGVDDDNDAPIVHRFRPKKRKTAMHTLVLDYNNLLKNKLKAKLSLAFKSPKMIAVRLPTHGDYFNKITFLSLSGKAVNYHSSFFRILFREFHNLVTLTVECPTISSCEYYNSICRFISASQSMKNLRVIDKGMEFKTIFDSLSQCKTLENIHLVDQKYWDHSKIADPTLLIQECANLYSVFIIAPFAEVAHTKQLQWFNKVKTTCKRPHLRAVINRVAVNNKFKYEYDPFIDVFQLNSMKPI